MVPTLAKKIFCVLVVKLHDHLVSLLFAINPHELLGFFLRKECHVIPAKVMLWKHLIIYYDFVATCVFGLGINKPDKSFVILNGFSPSIWTQEYSPAGQDDNETYAYILYSDNDIQYIGYWAYNMARQHRSSYINSSAQQFS